MRPRAALLCIFLPLPAQAAGFNCKAAQTPREKAVCNSKDLSALDDRLARAYGATRTRLSPASAAAVEADQRDWLTWLDKVCPSNNPAIGPVEACLREHYGTRINQLSLGVQRIEDTLFFTRAHFVFVPGKTPDQDSARTDPGFGYGEFAWPQVDAPDPDHAAFNAAAFGAAQEFEGVSPKGKPASFDNAVGSSGYVDGGFALEAANGRFIEVAFGTSSYGWGAAHPLSGQSSFLWRLDTRHALTASDVFRSGPESQDELIALTVAKLQRLAAGGDLVQGQELRKAVAGAVTDPTAWDLTANGLTLTFGQYAAGPYSSGMPSVTFTWGELAPYLNPGFNPASLPPRRTQAN